MIGHDLHPAPLADECGDMADAALVHRDARTAHRGPHADVSDAVDGFITGQRDAATVLEAIVKGIASPDDLHHACLKAWADGGTSSLRGAHRAIQKHLERCL